MRRCQFGFEALLDYVEGRLRPGDRARVESHLASGCSACREQVSILESLLPQLTQALAMDLPLVSASALQFAQNLFQTVDRQNPVESIREWVGRLVFDSRLRSALAGSRDESGQSVMCLYAAGPYQVDIWAEKQPAGSWYLIGQLTDQTESRAIAVDGIAFTSISGHSQTVRQEESEFHISSVASGSYTLTLRSLEDAIRVEEVIVGD